MKIKRKILSLLTIFIIVYSTFSWASSPEISSGAAILVESSTGNILFQKNAYEKMYPASTTKVLTAILTLENCDLDEMATVSHNAVFSLPAGYVTANLQEGEKISINDLMYALMLKSANDAAIVLAEHIAGSVDNFSVMMNDKAKEIGCKNTHFVNPNGMHNENHYSTAYDLYLMASYGMKNETFRKYVSTTSYTLPSTNKYPSADRICLTTNELLRSKSRYYNKNAIGIKTGTTTQAKNCLISGTRKNNVELISVILHAGTNSEGLSERYVETNSLFEYGFENFEFSNILEKDSTVKTIEVENGNKDTKNLELIAKETLSGYLSKEINLENLSPEIELQENIVAPIASGTVLGSATYTIDDITYSTELLAKSDVIKRFPFEIFILICAFLSLVLGIIILIKSRKKKLKKRRK